MGAPIARGGDSVATGHGCSGTTTMKGSESTGKAKNVYANKRPIECLGDKTEIHSAFSPPNCSPHQAVINAASTSVFINKKGVGRMGDFTDLGSITSGSADVFAGGPVLPIP